MDIDRIIKTSITTSELEASPEVVSSVNSGATPLLDVVKALGEYLTSTEDDIRLRGLTYLTNVLTKIEPSRVNRQATQTLTRFYLSKLDDFDSLPPALRALIVLSKLSTFDDEAAVEVFRVVCDQINMKAYVQATRHLVYELFDSFLALHRKALQAVGPEFLTGYTKMVDGEKDPRNLMLLFSMDRVILLEFDVKDRIEELFDITFCYFPITFKPPPNDPYGITADDLKLALRSCMSASPYFAPMAIPLFLEKFATAVGQSMKDVLLSMAACFPVYGADACRERGTELWEAIKTEVLYQSDATIEEAGLKALEALLATLYPSAEVAPTGLAQDAIKQCLEILEDPDKAQGLPATKSLVAMINAGPSTARYTVSQAMPQLFRQFNRPVLPSHRVPILWSISTILIALSKNYAATGTRRTYEDERPLDMFRDALMDTLREGLRTDQLREAAIRGCVALAEMPGFWAREDVETVVGGIGDVLLGDSTAEIRSAAVKGLASISKIHPGVIAHTTLPPLFHALPDTAPSIDAVSDREKYRSVLSSLGELCISPALFETLVVRILSKLDVLASAQQESASADQPMTGETEVTDRECAIAYAYDLLHCLAGVIDTKLDATPKHVDVLKHFETIVPRLYGLCFAAALTGKPALAIVPGSRDENAGPLFRDRRLLVLVGKLATRLVYELDAEKQAKHFAAVFSAFEQGKVEDIGVQGAGPIGVLSRAGATAAEQDLVVIYSSVVQALKPESALPFPSTIDFLAAKVNWVINVAGDAFQVRWCLDMITSIVNKRPADLAQSLPSIMDKIFVSDIQDTAHPLAHRVRALQTYLHIVKALALLRDPLAYSSIDRVIDLLKLAYFDRQFVEEVARGFSVLAEGKGSAQRGSSSKTSKGKQRERGWTLTARLLWAQKLWDFALPRLLEGDAEAKGRDRLVYLIALSALLPLVPPSLLLSQLPKVLLMILRSLSIPDAGTRVNAVVSLHGVLEAGNMSTEVDVLVHDRAKEMVEALLSCTAAESENSAKVRESALRALAIFPDAVRYEVLQGTKSQVIRDLGKALDDPVRSVRREAVECRAKWYRYGQPT